MPSIFISEQMIMMSPFYDFPFQSISAIYHIWLQVVSVQFIILLIVFRIHIFIGIWYHI